MTSEPDKQASSETTPPDEKTAAKKLIRFDFPPGATPEQIAEGIKKMLAQNKA